MVIDFVIRHVEASSRAATEALDELRLAYERLGRLHDRLEAAKEDERRFLAHELHDELGQTLTALKLRLQLGARGGGDAPAGSRPARRVALVDNLIARVRKMSVDLRPPLLDEVGLVPALRAYLEGQAALSGVRDGAGGGDRATPPASGGCRRIWRSPASASCRSRSPTRFAMRRPGSVSVRIARGGSRVTPVDPRTTAAASTAAHAGGRGRRATWAWSACASGCGRGGGTFQVASHPGKGTAVEVESAVHGHERRRHGLVAAAH